MILKPSGILKNVLLHHTQQKNALNFRYNDCFDRHFGNNRFQLCFSCNLAIIFSGISLETSYTE